MTSVSRLGFDETHELFRAGYASFLATEVVPYADKWEVEGIVDKGVFRSAGAAGFLGLDVPESFGGGAVADFRFSSIMAEEAARADVVTAAGGISLHNDVCIPYILHGADDEQKARWLPGICDGSLVLAVGMTEPATGSDLAAISTSAVRDGDHYVINGSKTFISSAFNADLVILACKTDPAQRHRGMSLIVAETATEGFERGRNLDKMGQHAADTGELFFNDMRVPVENLLGEEGSGFAQLLARLPRERLSIAVAAVAMAESAFQMGLTYAKERQAFGQPIGTFQHNRFKLAEMRTELDIARVFVDHQVDELNRGTLSVEAAAESKWWTTELLKRVVDTSLQLHGGYGYIEEYPIARMYRDARITTIYGGTTEIMKEIIGRSLGV